MVWYNTSQEGSSGMKKMMMLAAVGVLSMAMSAFADGKPLPVEQASMTNGVYTYTNTTGNAMYLDALDLKSASSGTWAAMIYNGNGITNSIVAAAAAQVEWRTNAVNAVRLNKGGVLSVTTTYLGVGSNAWVNAYWSAR
jgi:hypothetical protein